ncbi:4758_t:CDS:2 [Funneliformis caledonium]|uniref:4758_t:CDS:1 n=1 Tax=Funneliformis caledonium TaxID=1117310 RepID=A0A9N9D1X3_9GLOM|nr:4758_t:CDS:2 [Funneliformis caledonium]
MLAETSNPRDSYYSSLYDEYSSRGEERAYIVGSTWNHAAKTVKRRPSLNLHPRTNSISSLKRQPSFDCPSPPSHLVSSNSNPINSLFNYTASGSFSPSPPSPGYVFTRFNSYNNIGPRESLTGKQPDERTSSLSVPMDTKRNSAENRAPSPSESSILEDYNDYHTRHSSASSFEDVLNKDKANTTKKTLRTSTQSQINLNEQQQQVRTFSRQNSTRSRSSINGRVRQKQDCDDRDQYGFRRSYQWITKKEYTEFESSYVQVLHRRKQKWDIAIEENGGVIPGRSSKMKRYVRKGVPPSLRGKVWFHYSGAEAKMRDHMDFYQQLLIKAQDPRYENEYVEIIERDLHRTFPENIKFKSTVDSKDGSSPVLSTDNVPIIQSLRRVLTAFSLFSPNIGYCQSLNYVVGILLLFMDEEQAFWMLVTIIHDYLPENMYDVTMEGANVDQAVLMMFVMEKMPQIWNKLSGGFGWDIEKLDKNMPTITLTLLRVWDCLFYEGNKVLFRVALAILKLNEEKILAVNDPMEIFQVVQNMPKSLLDCHKLIDLCFRRRKGLSQKDIDKRREFFRERRKKRVGSMLLKH